MELFDKNNGGKSIYSETTHVVFNRLSRSYGCPNNNPGLIPGGICTGNHGQPWDWYVQGLATPVKSCRLPRLGYDCPAMSNGLAVRVLTQIAHAIADSWPAQPGIDQASPCPYKSHSAHSCLDESRSEWTRYLGTDRQMFGTKKISSTADAAANNRLQID